MASVKAMGTPSGVAPVTPACRIWLPDSSASPARDLELQQHPGFGAERDVRQPDGRKAIALLDRVVVAAA